MTIDQAMSRNGLATPLALENGKLDMLLQEGELNSARTHQQKIHSEASVSGFDSTSCN